MSAVDITKLQQYCEEYKKDLIMLAVTSASEMMQHFNVIPGIKDKYTLTTLEMKKLLKPYKKDWSPDDEKAALVPRTLRVEIGQVELEEEPLKYRKTYLGHLMRTGVNPDDHPFEKDFLESIVRQVGADINDELVFFGERDPDGSDPASVNDGFFKIIEDAITANELTPITIGAIDSTNAVAKLKLFYRSIPKAYRRKDVNMYMSYDKYDAYCDNYQAENGALPYNTRYEKLTLEGSGGRCTLVPLSAMGDSERIIISPRENMCIGVDLESDQEDVQITKGINPKVVGFFLALAFGVQIASLRAVWVNDVEEPEEPEEPENP